jgi:putative membrane protein
MKNGICFALTVAAFAWSACNNNDYNDDNSASNGADVSFMANSAYASRAEIETSQLAASQAASDSVKMFGQMMVDEHTMALNELESIANDLQVNLPTTLDNDHQQWKEKLTAMSGSKFDSAYIAGQIADHKTASMIAQLEIANGKASQVKNYASKYLSRINMHLQRADSIAKMLNDTTQNNSGPQ